MFEISNILALCSLFISNFIFQKKAGPASHNDVIQIQCSLPVVQQIAVADQFQLRVLFVSPSERHPLCHRERGSRGAVLRHLQQTPQGQDRLSHDAGW